jgi:hypothetical protein
MYGDEEYERRFQELDERLLLFREERASLEISVIVFSI